jgi:hypothetical protein
VLSGVEIYLVDVSVERHTLQQALALAVAAFKMTQDSKEMAEIIYLGMYVTFFSVAFC